jgi:O-methyltransferase involved in polyketide biosynthesis
MTPVADFDPNTPSIARVYDYLLNGKDNFAVDRAVADKLLAVAPIAAEVMRENRQFLARAARWAAEQGITQFIDLGCGMPTTPNTHQSAQAVTPDAHVAYVDTDAVVLTHLRALAAQGNPNVTVLDCDVREVDATLAAIRPSLDLDQPVCLLMGALLHFFPAREAAALVAGYAAHLAPGSYVVLSIGRADGDAEANGFGTYSQTGAARAYNHTTEQFAGFFGPLPVVPPGVIDARAWHPADGQPLPDEPRPGQALVGVARVS